MWLEIVAGLDKIGMPLFGYRTKRLDKFGCTGWRLVLHLLHVFRINEEEKRRSHRYVSVHRFMHICFFYLRGLAPDSTVEFHNLFCPRVEHFVQVDFVSFELL